LRLAWDGVAELGPRALPLLEWSSFAFPVVVRPAAEKRDEWRGRWRPPVAGAASARDASARTARTTATAIFKVLRVTGHPPGKSYNR